MAPEQRRGAIAPAADVYAAGVILVELCAGSAALAPWLGDRAALLRGDARWSGALPADVARHFGARAAELQRLAAALLADDTTARPSANDALETISAISR